MVLGLLLTGGKEAVPDVQGGAHRDVKHSYYIKRPLKEG
jgi:hypothetical protein